MTAAGKIEIRPRTTGEILDDAWRIYLADAPILLALTALFLVPVAIGLLLLLLLPRFDNPLLRWLVCLPVAMLLPLIGLASASCQQVFLFRSRGEDVSLFRCLGGMMACALQHLSLRTLTLFPFVLAGMIGFALSNLVVDDGAGPENLLSLLLRLIAPGLTRPLLFGMVALGLTRLVLSPSLCSLHPLLSASSGSAAGAITESLRDGLRQPGKATNLLFAQNALFVLAVLNIHVCVQLGLSVVGSFLEHVLSLGNPAYSLAVVLVVWLALTPLAEAVNFLFHVDARARHEGLDLWFRVQQAFPLRGKARTAVSGLLFLGLLTGAVPSLHAADASLETVRKARLEIEGMRTADPYPGGGTCAIRLRRLATELDPNGSRVRGPLRWFYQALEGFEKLSEDRGRQVLAELGQKLNLVEENLSRREDQQGRKTRDQLRELLPPGDDEEKTTRKKEEASSPEKPVKRDVEEDKASGGTRSRSLMGPAGLSGLNWLGWVVLGGLLLTVVVGAVVLLVLNRNPRANRNKKAVAQVEKLSPDDSTGRLLQEDPSSLWKQADQLARDGKHLEALRFLYAALLGLLHRANLIHFEPPRTNGEYLLQLRTNCPEASRLPQLFSQMTRRFEFKWYGDRTCAADEFQSCREVADSIRTLAVA